MGCVRRGGVGWGWIAVGRVVVRWAGWGWEGMGYVGRGGVGWGVVLWDEVG